MANRLRLVIGVLSGRTLRRRRRACLETWMAEPSRGLCADLVFAIGRPHIPCCGRRGPMLYLPCPDDYPSLAQKTRTLCLWAVRQGKFDYLLKCDDDTYVRIDRLLDAQFDAPYVGHDLGGYASGGAGYLLSYRAAQIIADELAVKTGCEDIEVAKTLALHGIRLTPDDRFQPWPKLMAAPRPDNDLITGHGWRPDQLRAIHARFHNADHPAS